MSKANTKDTALGHRETHKHEEGFHPTAKSHGVDKSMIAQGNHQGSGAPKGNTAVGKHMATDETTALDDERGSN